MLNHIIVSSNAHSDQTIQEADDAEPKMRQSLGLDGGPANDSPPSPSNDPMKTARQAIRSQVAAREYTERLLAQAQGAIQDLRTRLRHIHQDRETAISAAQSAMAARDAAERNMRAAETALATEHSTRSRIEGMLRDAEATIRDFRKKLATANQDLQTMRAERAAGRQQEPEADDGATTVPQIDAPPCQEPPVPIVRRPVGRPRKTAVVESIEQPIRMLKQPPAPPRDKSIRNAITPTVRRPVGRPRKVPVAQPVEKSIRPPETQRASAMAGTKKTSHHADALEPVQWWVEGWKKR